ncbi:MAG: hypothetical protein II951_07495 [Bacteroidales bacterium]|nr:hypothetical protein [Bacteroidales bacterium]
MSVSAVIDGFVPQAGDRIVAYADDEMCGAADAQNTENVVYMNIEGEGNKSLWFEIERDGEIVAR